MNLSALKDAFLPNRAIDRSVSLALIAIWAGLALLIWTLSPWETLPGPVEVWGALRSLWWEHGMGPELFTTLKLIFHALILTVIFSMTPRKWAKPSTTPATKALRAPTPTMPRAT